MDLLVEEAEGPVRVVCPNAQSEINESAAVATMRIRFIINLLSIQSLSCCKQLCQSLNRLEWTPARGTVGIIKAAMVVWSGWTAEICR